MILVWLCIGRSYEGLAANTAGNVKCATLGLGPQAQTAIDDEDRA